MTHERRGAPRVFAATACAAMLLLATPGSAGETRPAVPDGQPGEFERMIRQELDRVFEQIEGVLESLPRYALPEVTEDGDIIIRRLPNRPETQRGSREDGPDIVEL